MVSRKNKDIYADDLSDVDCDERELDIDNNDSDIDDIDSDCSIQPMRRTRVSPLPISDDESENYYEEEIIHQWTEVDIPPTIEPFLDRTGLNILPQNGVEGSLDGFSFEVKIVEDFEDGSFLPVAENTVIKGEILENEEMEQVSENGDECGKIFNSHTRMLRHKHQQHVWKNPQPSTTTETDKPTPPIPRSDKPISSTTMGCDNRSSTTTGCDKPPPTFPGDKLTSTPRDDLKHTPTGKAIHHYPESSAALVQHMRNVLKQQILKNPHLLTTETDKPARPPTTVSDKLTAPTTTGSDKPTTGSNKPTQTFLGNKPTSTLHGDQPTMSLRQKEYKCEVCKKTFKLHSSLVRHKLKHTGKAINYPESSAALVQHMRNVLKQQISKNTQLPITETDEPLTTVGDKEIQIYDGIRKHTCEYCGLSFTRAGNLATHRRTHTGEKPYSCKECGKSFSRPASWKAHQVEHAKQEEHVCQKCGATFAGAEDLGEHVKTHSLERPFKCTMCTRAFNSSWLQRRHVLMHATVRNHACEFCGKRFNRSFNLKVHRKIHKGETAHT